ncbi:MAG: 5-(carboxyamino)imidazole ribonucleotide synthase, partial [Bacteroidota bacterium]
MAKNTPKLGILGGGQLGKMLCQAGADWHLPIHVLDQDAGFPAAPYATVFTPGNFRDTADVLAFGRQMDVVTIEIEHIDTGALHQLMAEGIKVYPQPDKVDLIKDKGLQKQFYTDHGLATTPFELFSDAAAVREAVGAG